MAWPTTTHFGTGRDAAAAGQKGGRANRRELRTPDYRDGYQAGWRAAKREQEAAMKMLTEVLDETRAQLAAAEKRIEDLSHSLVAALERANAAESRLVALEPPPTETRCTVCRADFPTTGQRVGTTWSVWGPGFRVCKRCVETSRDARRVDERDKAAEPARQ